MSENQKWLPLKFDAYNDLEINDKSFTAREFDVLACKLNAHTNKQISEYLGIKPKVIQDYLGKIRSKIGVGNIDNIISFVSKSDKFNVLREKHYRQLLYNYNLFVSYIDKLRNLTNDKDMKCTIEFRDDLDEKNEFLQRVKDDLRKLNIDAHIKERPQNLRSIRKEDKCFILTSSLPNAIQDTEEKKSHIIMLPLQESYYGLLFEILDILLKNDKVSKVKAEINTKHEEFISGKSENLLLLENESKIQDHCNTLQITTNFFYKKNSYYLLMIPVLFLILLSTYFYFKQSDTKPWNTPYLPEHFVTRAELRNKIVDKLKNSDQKLNQAILVGLHGLGGVGKTYLAFDMIYHPAKNYSFRGWITANDEDKLKADYFKLGDELGILKDGMNETQKITVVKNWLDNQQSLLLVFDNVPNIEIIEKYLPQKGDIIITSRNYKMHSAIEVDVMEEGEAITLLRKLIHDPKCEGKCTDLVKKLGYLPLAISQAGAYIEQNKITIDKYLALYKEEQDILLSSNIMPVTDKHMSVYITWNLSFKEIREKDKIGKAIKLLDLLSFCHFVDIPKEFLIEYLYGKLDSKTEIEFSKIIDLLRQYSLLKVEQDTVAIHHLVQDCIRSNMKSDEKKLVLKKAVDTIKKIYPLKDKKFNDYDLIKILLPQMENLFTYTKEQSRYSDAITLAIYIGDAYRKFGEYNKAKRLLEEVLVIQEHYYGTRKHIEISFTIRGLGQIYLLLDDYYRAKVLLDEALEFQEKYYKTRQHIEITFTLGHLGRAYSRLGDYNKGKDLLEEALAFQENYYDTHEHMEIAFTLSHLGYAYLWLGDYSKAEASLEESLAIQERHYSTRQHIDVSFTLSRLGHTYVYSGNYSRAKDLLEEALALQENCYGTRKHIDVSFTLNRLGQAYTYLGNYSKAKELLEEALDFREIYYGTRKHIDISFTLNALGYTYLLLGDYTKSKVLLEEAFVIQENYYGPDHPEIANSMIALAQLAYATKDNERALFLIDQANNILQNYQGLNPEHNYIKLANKLKQEILQTQQLDRLRK